jgi:hypothetical protein
VDNKEWGERYVKEVLQLHGLPQSIVLDREPQFASDIWKHICERLEIEPRLLTVFQPQTDSQTKRINTKMEQYLKNIVHYQEDHWVWWLQLAEFAANNHTLETTNCSAFSGSYGFHR